MKKLMILAGLCLLLSACGEPPAPALLEPVKVPVQTTAVQRGDISDMTAYEGITVPAAVPCGFTSGGTVAEVLVSRGDRVSAGDVLAVLDCGQLEEQLQDTERQQQELLEDGDLADRRYALELQRIQTGNSPDAAAEAELLESLYLEAQEARASRLEQLEADAEALRSTIGSAELTAPCSGTVLRSDVLPGTAVQPGQTAVIITDDSELRITAEWLDERLIGDAELIYATVGGTRHEVRYEPYDREVYITKMITGEELSSTFRLTEPGDAEPGMYTLIYVVSARAEDVLWLPANAVFRDAEGPYVYLSRDGEQVRTPVETGLETQAQSEIRSGLQEGDVVYVG